MDHANHHGGMMDMNSTTMSMMMMDNGTMNPHGDHGSGGMDHGSGGMDHGSGGTGHGTGHDTAEHTMQMFFHTGVTEYILFEKLLTSNVGGLVGACVVIFGLSVLYEGLKYLREYLLRRTTHAARQEAYLPSSAPNGGVVAKQPEVGTRMLSCSHALQTLLHMVQVFVSYCLMLVFMTYNVYLCVAIIVGAGVGYFLFGWRRAMVVDMNEHCH